MWPDMTSSFLEVLVLFDIVDAEGIFEPSYKSKWSTMTGRWWSPTGLDVKVVDVATMKTTEMVIGGQ